MKIAVIGCGTIAASHLRILKKIKPDAVLAICDINEAKARELASKSSVTRIYNDVGKMLLQDQPDSVHIVTPPKSHVELAEQCLAAGCNVYVEKPITESSIDFVRLDTFATSIGKIYYGGYSTLGMPVVLKLREEIQSGKFGKLISAHCNFAGSEKGGVIPYGNPNHWAYTLRGGVLQNMIDHPLSLIVSVLKEINDSKITVIHRNVLPNNTPDLINVSLRSGDQIGSFTLSLGHGCNDRRAQFLLEKGTIVIDMGRQLYSAVRGSGPQNFIKKGMSGLSEGYAYFGGTIKNVVNGVRGKLQRDPGIYSLLDNYYAVIEKNESRIVTGGLMHTVTQLLDKIWSEIEVQKTSLPIKVL